MGISDIADYLADLPDVLELSWRGRQLRITHGRTASGEWASWRATTGEMYELFADPTVDLTVVAHTHCPFVRAEPRGQVANCGSTSCLILGHETDDGAIQSKTEAPFHPVEEIYSTYLSVTAPGASLDVSVERFSYDLLLEVDFLQDLGHPRVEVMRKWLETGVFWKA